MFCKFCKCSDYKKRLDDIENKISALETNNLWQRSIEARNHWQTNVEKNIRDIVTERSFLESFVEMVNRLQVKK